MKHFKLNRLLMLLVAFLTMSINLLAEDVELYRESFVSTTTKAAAATADKVTATQSMFYDKSAKVWSHYTTCSSISKNQTSTHPATQSYCSGKSTTSIQHTAAAASTEYTILEVTGIDISGATALKLNYAFGFSGGTNYKVFAKIDDSNYIQLATASSGNQWQYKTDLCIAGEGLPNTGEQLSLKFTYKSNKANNMFYLDEILVTGTKSSTYTASIVAPLNGSIKLNHSTSTARLLP